MKKLLFMGMCLVVAAGMQAQTFQEWFFQNKTQIKYLHRQIAALAAFISDVGKGYALIVHGTDTIGVITLDDLHLHSDYFASLESPKPAIVVNGRMEDAAALQVGIVANVRVCDSLGMDVRWLTAAADVERNSLNDLLTDDVWQLSDAERCRLVEKCSQRMGRLFRVSMVLRNAVVMIAGMNADERLEVESLKRLYGME